MSVSGFAASFLVYGYFLPLVFLCHILSLAITALWNGQSLLTVLQDVISIEDDICLPYPPGYFDFSKIHPQDFQDEHPLNDDSFSSDASTADDSDESILSVTQEITCIIPVIIVSNDSNDKLSCFALDGDTSLLPKDGRDFSNTSASHVVNILKPLMPIRSAASMITSSSRREENLSTDADYSPSLSTHERQFGLTEVADPAKLVVNSSTCEETSSQHVDCDSISLPSLASGLAEESDDLDLTEEEEAILETLCIQMPDVVPTIEQLAENPHVPANVPVFSRHNISSKVVFPARKPSSPPPAVQCRSSFSENTNSMFGQMSASWRKTKTELQQRRDRSSPLSSTISSKFSDISNARVFSTQARDSMIPEWIRNSTENGAGPNDYCGEEEGSTYEFAFGYFQV
ncbi:hypothetical protein APHAL10511_000928 [Amanita phalloides]|nr:hypothetical protein APHAL10511_000928 [Amanita phalloides]